MTASAHLSQPRVAIIAALFPTVSETFVLNQVTGLIDLGYAVDVYAWEPEGPETSIHHQLEQYQLERSVTYLPRQMNREEVTKQFQERRYCAVHCHFGYVAEKLSFLKERLEHVPFLVTFHGADIRNALEKGSQVLRSTFETFNWFIAICRYNRELLEQLGCPPDQIVDLPNGVDTAMFRPGRRRRDGPLRIATVARLHVSKNIPFALGVMKRLSELGLDYRYDVLGHGPERPEIEFLIEDLGLSSRVTLHGQCSQQVVARHLSRSDLFFLPSRNEASPVCILEAMAASLPVVATRVGGVAELVEDGKTGYVVESGDEEAAADRILELSDNPVLRTQMGSNGRKRVRRNHEFRMLNQRIASMFDASPDTIKPRKAVR